ncbi:uncharacterized protein LOC123300983 [Chrysoperla carnea]|uniref:uncharacterized protein LOC123300983 n=1 Tax=Chrysoperla carnea TaxID=189513 RepID=UPI001D0854B0|nr:uncharacterized protein LOC123300983 [Chrysoperla carnea]
MNFIQNNGMDVKSLKEKILAWDMITQEFNNTASENGIRSVVEIKYLFDSLKKAARKVLRRKKAKDWIASSPIPESAVLNKGSCCSLRKSWANLISTFERTSAEKNLRIEKEPSTKIFDIPDSLNNQKAIALCENCEADSKSSTKLDTPNLSFSKSQRKNIDTNNTTMVELEILQLRKDIARFQRDKAFFETQRAILELKEKKMDLRIKEIMLNGKV